MLECRLPTTETDQTLARAAKLFAEDIGAVSSDPVLREGILQAAMSMLIKALEAEFDGYQGLLSNFLREQSELLKRNWDSTPDSAKQ